MKQRSDMRRSDELRRFTVTYDIFSQADASVLFELGNTKILCAITLQTGVPPFLRGNGVGWLNAEYAMLPTATTIRTQRESTQYNRNGRAVEISRLIGRVLRTITDLSKIGERTIHVDCDVLQADGGTRSASIIAANLALKRAQEIWLSRGAIMHAIMRDDVAAISIGVTETALMVDPNYLEDSTVQADFNFIITRSGRMIEVHGGAEHGSIAWEMFDKARKHAIDAAQELFEALDTSPKNEQSKQSGLPLFSLKNRLSQKQSV